MIIVFVLPLFPHLNSSLSIVDSPSVVITSPSRTASTAKKEIDA
jgi:hypothetical protein